MFQNFREVEKIVQQIPMYPSYSFTNCYDFATFALPLYVYIHLFINIYFIESFESKFQRS